MSRTYRWKNLGEKNFQKWAGYQYDNNGDLKPEYRPPQYCERYTHYRVEEARAHYHAEWKRGIPKGARHPRNKSYRRQERQLLIRILRGYEGEFNPFKKDAGYYYW